jgi:Protein kinase domain
VQTDREPAILAERYRLETLLERTPLGHVWLARDGVLDRAVTVTLVDPRIGADADARDRLFADARTLATASPARLVKLLDAGMDGDIPFLVTERAEGETLEDVMHREGRLPPARAAAVVTGVLDALTEEHALGVLHLALSPGDVLLEDGGRVRLAHAGIAQAAAAAGTIDVSAPGGLADARVDVWAAGALLFALVSGHSFDPARDAPERAHAPRSLRSVLARSLASDPDERFPDARSMASALRAGASPERRPGRVRRVVRTWLAVPVLVVIIGGGVVAAGLWLGRLEIGGPLGIRTNPDAPSTAPAPEPIAVTGISVLDPPPGDGRENDDTLAAAIDGDQATAWSSENYFDGELRKPGIGLVLDLGRSQTVTGFKLETPVPGFSFSVLVGDDRRALLRDAEAGTAPAFTAPDSDRSFGPSTGRYVLVWITSVVPTPDGAHRAEVSEVRVFGTR